MNTNELLNDTDRFAALDDDTARAQILHYEKKVECLLQENKINQEMAWDLFFCLLHECDCRNFLKDRERILNKINREEYNPFNSSNVAVRTIVAIRLQAIKNGETNYQDIKQKN